MIYYLKDIIISFMKAEETNHWIKNKAKQQINILLWLRQWCLKMQTL